MDIFLLLSQLIEKVILHFHLPGFTSDIIMSVLHESFMSSASFTANETYPNLVFFTLKKLRVNSP